MSIPAKTYRDYVALAQNKGLEFTGHTAPDNVRQRTTWRCLNCGKHHDKTYRAIQLADHGCPCYKRKAEDVQRYNALATALGIEWVYDGKSRYTFPKNTKDKTSWRGPSGRIIQASYHELAFATSRNRAAFKALGIPMRDDSILVEELLST